MLEDAKSGFKCYLQGNRFSRTGINLNKLSHEWNHFQNEVSPFKNDSSFTTKPCIIFLCLQHISKGPFNSKASVCQYIQWGTWL